MNKPPLINLGAHITAIQDAMTDRPNVDPLDVETAFNITLKASKLWVTEGVPAAANFFDARARKPRMIGEEIFEDEPFLEELDTEGGNRHQREDEDEEADDTASDPNADFPAEDVTKDLEKAFDSLQANAEELANQAAFMPLCDDLDAFFSALNQLAGDNPPGDLKKPGIFVKQVEIMLNRPVFTRGGFLGVWRTIAELYNEHCV